MCMSSPKTPTPPPLPPAAPPPPTEADPAVAQARSRSRTNAALGSARASTILTSTSGLTDPASTTKKSLLGV